MPKFAKEPLKNMKSNHELPRSKSWRSRSSLLRTIRSWSQSFRRSKIQNAWRSYRKSRQAVRVHESASQPECEASAGLKSRPCNTPWALQRAKNSNESATDHFTSLIHQGNTNASQPINHPSFWKQHTHLGMKDLQLRRRSWSYQADAPSTPTSTADNRRSSTTEKPRWNLDLIKPQNNSAVRDPGIRSLVLARRRSRTALRLEHQNLIHLIHMIT